MKIVRPVVETVGGMGGRLRNLARLDEVARILLRHGLGILVQGLDLPGVPKVATFESTPARAVAAIQELGPTYVKLGQVLSTRPDLLPDDYVTALEQLQDDVDALPWQDMAGELDRALPDWRDGIDLDETPLATASIAQVHRGTLPDGREVVLKIQRPGIAPVIRADLAILHLLAKRLLHEYPESRSFDPLGVLAEFERSILAELDFRKEVEHMAKFATNFEGDPRCHIPEVHPQLCTDTVLCMEFLKGIPIRQARAAGFDMKVVGDNYLTVAYDMLFVHGLFHGDMHPGNVLVLDDGRLGLLDFGMVGRLSQEMRTQVVSIMFALQRGDYRTIARLFYEIAIKDDRVDYNEIERDTVEVMEKHWAAGSSIRDMQMGPYVMELAARAAKHGARVPAAYTMFFKAIVTSEGLAKSLIEEVDPIGAIRPYFTQMMAERFTGDALQQEGFYHLLTLSSLLQRLPVAASMALDDFDAQRLQINVRNVVDPEIEVNKDRRMQVAVLAGFSVTLALCGAIVASGGLVWVGLGLFVWAVSLALTTVWWMR